MRDPKRQGQVRQAADSYAYTSDFLPFFGEVPNTTNAFVASGLGSSGLTSGVWIGELLARMAAGEEVGFSVEKYTPQNYVRKV